MNRLATYIFSSITILLVSACSDSAKPNYQELGWKDLRPIEENVVDEGASSIGDDWSGGAYRPSQGLRGMYSAVPSQTYSTGVVSEVDGKNIRVPGFIVPLEFDAGNLVTEFFLVPSFGACFHNPPPPPNQTIYVTSVEPIEFESIYDPVWIMGVMKTELTGNEIATAAYGMDLHDIEIYTE